MHPTSGDRRLADRSTVKSLLGAALVVAVSVAAVAAEPSQGVGFEGLGNIRIGMPLWTLLDALHAQVTVEAIEGGCTSIYDSVPPKLTFMVVDGRLARIEVNTPDVATLSGIRVGDTESDVAAAYGGRVEVSDHEYQEGHYLTVYSRDRSSAVVFDTDGERIRSFRIGRLPEALHVEGCS